MLFFHREILRFAAGISPLPSADPRQPVIRAKSTIVSPLECALARHSPVSPLECAVIKRGGGGDLQIIFASERASETRAGYWRFVSVRDDVGAAGSGISP